MAVAAYEKVATLIADGSSNALTISALPNTYSSLKVVLSYTGTSTGTQVYLRFNGNINGRYYYGRDHGYGSNRSTESDYVENNSLGFPLTYTAYGVDSNTTLASFELDIFNYGNSTTVTNFFGLASGQYQTQKIAGSWFNESIVTSMTFWLTSGNYNAGSTLTIWGVK